MDELAAETRKERRALLALALGLMAPLAYMLQRAFEVTVGGGATPNPALVLRSTHASFYWRAVIAAWWAGVLGIACWRWALRQEPKALADALGRIALLWAVLLPIAAWLLP